MRVKERAESIIADAIKRGGYTTTDDLAEILTKAGFNTDSLGARDIVDMLGFHRDGRYVYVPVM